MLFYQHPNDGPLQYLGQVEELWNNNNEFVIVTVRNAGWTNGHGEPIGAAMVTYRRSDPDFYLVCPD